VGALLMAGITLTEHSEDSFKAAIVKLASDIQHWRPEYDQADALYELLIKGLSAYVEAWANVEHDQKMPVDFVLDAADLDDPSRVLDPLTARRATLLELLLVDMWDYVCGDLKIPARPDPEEND
jgi:hypothetical protein